MKKSAVEGTSRNRALLDERVAHVARGVATTHPIFAARAQGTRLWDVDGAEYLDFASGIGVLAVGHNHPRVTQAIRVQLERLSHTCFQVAMYEPYVRLAARLNALVGGSGPRKSLFVTTGAEAVENAVKIARAYTNRPGVVAFTGGFHGRTLLAMSLTGLTHAYKQNFGPSAPEIYRAPYPYEYRGWTADRAIGALEELFKTQIASNRIAAIIIEPELGDGGFVPAPASFMRELRRITERHGIILIVDEIQTGFGRTGHLFGFRHSDIEPDLVVVAKSLAGGLPLSGVVGHAHIMDSAEPGGLGGTYAGNPLACAAALAVLDIVEEEELVERARDLGTRLRSGLESLRRRFASIGDVRGLGAMLAIELVRDRETREPDPGLTARLLERTREHGVLLLKCGIFGNVVRVLMPLIAQEEDVNRCIEVLGLAFEEAA